MLTTQDNFLFYWTPAENKIEFVKSGCNPPSPSILGGSTTTPPIPIGPDESPCAKFLDTSRTSLLYRIADAQDQKST